MTIIHEQTAAYQNVNAQPVYRSGCRVVRIPWETVHLVWLDGMTKTRFQYKLWAVMTAPLVRVWCNLDCSTGNRNQLHDSSFGLRPWPVTTLDPEISQTVCLVGYGGSLIETTHLTVKTCWKGGKRPGQEPFVVKKKIQIECPSWLSSTGICWPAPGA